MGGLEATRIVRTIEKSTNEPPVGIVAMTAATSKEDEEECMRSGFTLYLPKPVKFAALKELVERKRLEKCKTLELKEVRQQNDAIPASAECHDEKPPSTC
jgi:CheY-like chemotaxis protein